MKLKKYILTLLSCFTINVNALEINKEGVKGVDYGSYSNYSDLVKDIGKKELEKNFNISNNYWEIIERVGDVNDKEGIRNDVLEYIRGMKTSDEDKEIIKNSARILQSMMRATKDELEVPENLIFLNVNLFAQTICLLKNRESKESQKEVFQIMSAVEDKTINTELRKKHFEEFNEFTGGVSKIVPNFSTQLILTAYEVCYEKKPTKEDIDKLIQKVKNHI